MENSSDKKLELFNQYLEIVKENNGHTPSLGQILPYGITKDQISHHFQSISNLDKCARASNSEVFADVPLANLFTKEKAENIKKLIKNNNKFVITTAVSGCSVDFEFLLSLKKYCKMQDAVLLILVASGQNLSPVPVHAAKMGLIDKNIADENIVMEDIFLNKNVLISVVKTRANTVDPTTGMARIGQRNGTHISAAPKQRLKALPTSNNSLPHFQMTTGAVTQPEYIDVSNLPERSAYIADHDHCMGAIIIEKEDDTYYHFTQIQADDNSSFIHFGKHFSHSNEEYKPTLEAFIWGDWHSGMTDPDARKTWFTFSKKFKPKRIVLHDAFDGLSINHHERHNHLLRARRAMLGQLDLEAELKNLAQDLKDIAELTKIVVIVKSNHDQFLSRYLAEGLYIKDPQNHYLALKLATAMLEGKDPLQFAIEQYLDVKTKKKLEWLAEGDDYWVAGSQLGAHGHRGGNGARGSIISMEQSYGQVIFGHSHSPQILRGAWNVGTSSLLDLEYNVGSASSWLHSSCLLWDNGTRQLVNCIEGKHMSFPKV